MSTLCHVIQLLEPYPAIDPTVLSNDSLTIEEGGILALTGDGNEYSVFFTTPKLSVNYVFLTADVTSTDPDPLVIDAIMTDRDVNGFSLKLDGVPDTSNYVFNWRVRVTSV